VAPASSVPAPVDVELQTPPIGEAQSPGSRSARGR